MILQEASDYLENLQEPVRRKMFYQMDLLKQGIYTGNFKKLIGSDIWEFSINQSSGFYRLSSFWDRNGNTETLVVCTHGFNKQSNKTPPNEIRKAENIRNKYFIERKNRNF